MTQPMKQNARHFFSDRGGAEAPMKAREREIDPQVDLPPQAALTTSDLFLHALAVARFGAGQAGEVLGALCWVFLNRRIWSQQANPIGTEGEPHWVQACLMDPLPLDLAHVISVCADVFAGRWTDPVGGATRFHHHCESPAWADEMELNAIIGSFLFYRASDAVQ